MACRVLVTGSEGFIGGVLVRKLTDAGHEVLRYDLKRGQDVLDERVLRDNMETCSVVYNLAGEIRVPRSEDVPEVYWRNNTLGALAVARIAANLGVKMVQASSSAVIAGTASHYAMSKQSAEKIILHEVRRNYLQASIARIFNVYGPGQPQDFVIPRFIEQALADREIILDNGGVISKDFIHVEDVVSGLIACANSPNGIYDLGTGTATSVKSVAKRIIDMTYSKSKTVTVFNKGRAMDKSLVADKKKWPRNWSPQKWTTPSIEEMVRGIRETVEV